MGSDHERCRHRRDPRAPAQPHAGAQRGTRATECEADLWQIDDLPVIPDPYVDVDWPYAVSYGGGELWR